MSCFLRKVIRYRVPISKVNERHKSCWIQIWWNVRVQKDITDMLLISRTVMFIVVWEALAFLTGSGKVYYVLCRSVRLLLELQCWKFHFNQLYTDHLLLLNNEVHYVIERNLPLEIETTTWNKINFRVQNRLKCKPCGIAKRVLSFIVAVHRFIQKRKHFHFRQKSSADFWSQAGIGEKFHQWLDTLVAGTTVLLLLGTTFEERFFRVASCCC